MTAVDSTGGYCSDIGLCYWMTAVAASELAVNADPMTGCAAVSAGVLAIVMRGKHWWMLMKVAMAWGQ